jgi:hypothetical protein
VVLRGAADPFVSGQLSRIDADLPCNVGNRRWRKLARVTWEAGLDLEELQNEREAEPGRATLVGDQLPLVLLDQRPGRDQLLGLSLAPHNRLLERWFRAMDAIAKRAENHRSRHICAAP